MSENSEYGLVCSFGIDNGELEYMTPREIFVYGFEMGRTCGVCETLDHGDSARFMIHSDNHTRNAAAATAHKCQIEFKWVNDDWLDAMVSKQ